MTQQQLHQQQQTGPAAILADSAWPVVDPADLQRASSHVAAVALEAITELLSCEQLVRVECLNAARDLILTVPPEGGTRLDTLDLLTVAQYIATGQDPFEHAPKLKVAR